MMVFISIDDTDNLDSRGTGYIARTLATSLQENGFGTPLAISRHQLLVDPAIPYTSHNSSLCIQWETDEKELTKIIAFCSQFLKDQSAVGSDPGLCVAYNNQLSQTITKFGETAQQKVLTKKQAIDLAEMHKIHLSEHGGTGGGVIGALAGAGLTFGGNDGRYVWLRGIREMEGIFSAREILEKSGIQAIQSITGENIQQEDLIDVGDWFRPVLIDHKPTLLIETNKSGKKARWKIVDKTYIKAKY
jgi:hypothetical protein